MAATLRCSQLSMRSTRRSSSGFGSNNNGFCCVKHARKVVQCTAKRTSLFGNVCKHQGRSCPCAYVVDERLKASLENVVSRRRMSRGALSTRPSSHESSSDRVIASDGTVVPEGHESLHESLYGRGGAEAEHGSARRQSGDAKDEYTRAVAEIFTTPAGEANILPINEAIAAIELQSEELDVGKVALCGTFGLYMAAADHGNTINDSKPQCQLQTIGFSRNLLPCIKLHRDCFRLFVDACEEDTNEDLLHMSVRLWKKEDGMATREKLITLKNKWSREENLQCMTNELFTKYWAHLRDNSNSDGGDNENDLESGEISMRWAHEFGAMDDVEKNMYEDKKLKLQKAMGKTSSAIPDQSDEGILNSNLMQKAVHEDDWSAVINQQTAETLKTESPVSSERDSKASPFASSDHNSTNSSQKEIKKDDIAEKMNDGIMTVETVNETLNEVRPYLIADGGDVEVVSVDDDQGVVVLRLQGACGSCPSSSTTMKLGIERVLKERFGGRLKEVLQADENGMLLSQSSTSTTIAAIDAHLDTLRPAIVNYGGEIQVLDLLEDNTVVSISYTGPEPILMGIKAAIKDKFPSVSDVVVIETD